MKALVVGAGVIGCFTAALLQRKGIDVSLLARGARADRLEREGLHLRDGLSGETTTQRLDVVRAPENVSCDVALVCVQEQQRASVAPLLEALPGAPVIWYLGNTTKGYDAEAERFGRDRVLGGFPGVGGTWEGEVLVFADREKPGDRPFDRLVMGEAHADAAGAAEALKATFERAGVHVERHVPIMAWHWCHVAMVLPLAGAVYRHDGDLEAAASDRALLRQTMRASAQALGAIRRAGHPILPRGLHVMRFLPAALGAGRIASLLRSDFGRIAIAGHAAVARDEMRAVAVDLLALAGDDAGPDLRAVVGAI